jgi:hypothetical protein
MAYTDRYTLADFHPDTQAAYIKQAQDDIDRMMPWTHGRTLEQVVQGALDSTYEADQRRYAELSDH